MTASIVVRAIDRQFLVTDLMTLHSTESANSIDKIRNSLKTVNTETLRHPKTAILDCSVSLGSIKLFTVYIKQQKADRKAALGGLEFKLQTLISH
uniref:Uncharacterized protein n=1 Tax=Romanomermis culicivorax TaxID=13658 RepID=A0A915JZK2_ROMCU